MTLDPTLRRGDFGDAPRILQDLLNDARRRAGLASIAVDGAFGPGTEAAVKDFQRTKGLPQTGVVEATTWTALHAENAKGVFGTLDPVAPPLAGDTYKRAGSSTAEVEIHVLPEIDLAPGLKTKPLLANTSMSIDADGAGNAWKSDPSGQPNTSLRYANGASVDPTVIPYFVLPLGFKAKHVPTHLGDLAAVIYKGKVAYAIFADEGPRTQIGEGSIRLAQLLGINPSPTSGGTSSGVTYVVFPGSGNGLPQTPAEIEAKGRALFVKAGGKP